MAKALLKAYTKEVLAFDLPTEEPQHPKPISQDVFTKALKRISFKVAKTPEAEIIILGIGTGNFIKQIALEFSPKVMVIETDIVRARQFSNTENITLLADTSVPALLMLTLQYCASSPIVIRNPECDFTQSTAPLRKLENFLLRSRFFDQIPTQQTQPDLTVGAILHPQEPNLQEFAGSLPKFITELVLVWDCQSREEISSQIALIEANTNIPVKHIVRPLDHDFSAQRNAMLEATSTEWMIYIDADERFSESAWQAIHQSAEFAMQADVTIGGYYFPRQTYLGDTSQCRIGYGLWPDLQLRLFRTKGVRFINPVHEQLQGINHPTAILPHCVIHHYSHLSKAPETLERKLDLFSRAANEDVHHVLNKEYPAIMTNLLQFEDVAEVIVLPTK
ncbi:MAG: glycosyltransferase [Desulfovibrio sp.]